MLALGAELSRGACDAGSLKIHLSEELTIDILSFLNHYHLGRTKHEF
jgi:hypothetical protein